MKVTTTKRPVTKPPKRQPITTTVQQYDEPTEAFEEEEAEGEEEDVGEETAEESTPYFESGRVREYFLCIIKTKLAEKSLNTRFFSLIFIDQYRMWCTTARKIGTDCWWQRRYIW